MGKFWIPETLSPIAYRLARADSCAYLLAEKIASWSAQKPVDLRKEQHDSGRVEIVVAGVRVIPPEVALIFSEGIHHLRATLDNVVWHLVVREQGELDDDLARRVAFPIYEDSTKFAKWQKSIVKNGLTALEIEHELGQRLRNFQPFADSGQSVASVSTSLLALSGIPRDIRHPLRLIQDYSNEDKHRQIRMAAAQSVISTTEAPIWGQDLRLRSIEVCDVVLEMQAAEPVMLDLNTALMVQRPAGVSTWVNPVIELSSLRSYVADIAVPFLLKGLELPGGIPPGIDLGIVILSWMNALLQLIRGKH